MLAVELANYLDEQGIGTFDESGTGGDIFICTMPDTPDNAIAIYPTGGYKAGVKLALDQPTLEVIVRGGQDPRPAAELAQSIYDLVHGLGSDRFQADGTYIVSCQGIQSGPNHLGPDANGRHEYSINFQLITVNENRR